MRKQIKLEYEKNFKRNLNATGNKFEAYKNWNIFFKMQIIKLTQEEIENRYLLAQKRLER